MKGNPLTGEAVICLADGRELRLQLTMRRMLELQAALGDEYIDIVQEALKRTDIKVLAAVLTTALRQHQPAITEDDVLDLDTSWLDLQAALLVAWRRFFSGDKPPPEIDETGAAGEGESAGPLGVTRS